MSRSELCDAANALGRSSRRGGAPTLSPDSARETLIAWLYWCDPNGCYGDESAAHEGFDPLTLDAAWELIADLMRDE